MHIIFIPPFLHVHPLEPLGLPKEDNSSSSRTARHGVAEKTNSKHRARQIKKRTNDEPTARHVGKTRFKKEIGQQQATTKKTKTGRRTSRRCAHSRTTLSPTLSSFPASYPPGPGRQFHFILLNRYRTIFISSFPVHLFRSVEAPIHIPPALKQWVCGGPVC